MEFLLESIINKKDHTVSRLIFLLNSIFILLVIVNWFFPIQENITIILNSFIYIELILNISEVAFNCALFLYLANASLSVLFYIINFIIDHKENLANVNNENYLSSIYKLYSYSKIAFIINFNLLIFSSFIIYFLDFNKLIFLLNSFINQLNLLKILVLSLSIIPTIYSVLDLFFSAIRIYLVPPFNPPKVKTTSKDED